MRRSICALTWRSWAMFLILSVRSATMNEAGAPKRRPAWLGLDLQFITETGCGATGISAVTLDAEGKATHNLPRPAAYDFMSLEPGTTDTSSSADSRSGSVSARWRKWNSVRAALARNILRDNPASGRFYDVNLRPRCWTPDLVETLMHEATAAKLNEDEAAALAGLFDWPLGSLRQFSELLARRFELELVCVTRGENGCCLWRSDEFVQTSGASRRCCRYRRRRRRVFPRRCCTVSIRNGRSAEVAVFANRVGALVASRPGATPAWTETEARTSFQQNVAEVC